MLSPMPLILIYVMHTYIESNRIQMESTLALSEFVVDLSFTPVLDPIFFSSDSMIEGEVLS